MNWLNKRTINARVRFAENNECEVRMACMEKVEVI